MPFHICFYVFNNTLDGRYTETKVENLVNFAPGKPVASESDEAAPNSEGQDEAQGTVLTLNYYLGC